eukprot:298986-Lingulodinium_polyedra.AAC.1
MEPTSGGAGPGQSRGGPQGLEQAAAALDLQLNRIKILRQRRSWLGMGTDDATANNSAQEPPLETLTAGHTGVPNAGEEKSDLPRTSDSGDERDCDEAERKL